MIPIGTLGRQEKYMYIHTYIHTYAHIHMYAHPHIHIHTHICRYVSIYIYMVYIYSIHIHIYIYGDHVLWTLGKLQVGSMLLGASEPTRATYGPARPLVVYPKNKTEKEDPIVAVEQYLQRQV